MKTTNIMITANIEKCLTLATEQLAIIKQDVVSDQDMAKMEESNKALQAKSLELIEWYEHVLQNNLEFNTKDIHIFCEDMADGLPLAHQLAWIMSIQENMTDLALSYIYDDNECATMAIVNSMNEIILCNTREELLNFSIESAVKLKDYIDSKLDELFEEFPCSTQEARDLLELI